MKELGTNSSVLLSTAVAAAQASLNKCCYPFQAL